MDLAAAVHLLLSNPFCGDPAAWQHAAKRVLAAPARDTARSFPDEDVALAMAVGARYTAPDDRESRVQEAVKRRFGTRSRFLTKSDARALMAIAAASEHCQQQLGLLKGESSAMSHLRQRVWSACFGATLAHARQLGDLIHDHDILLLGETGTGKETVAHAIMAGTIPQDGNQTAPTSKINVAEVPESLIESELFGHIKGAYTGATQARPGRIRNASGGCFFLDEVGDLSPQIQVKLLRVIETDEVNPVGSDENHPANVRYIAATHRDLPQMVNEGAFRRDLFERLAGDVIHLPPLRERPEDIPAIGMALVAQYPVREEDQKRVEAWLRHEETQSRSWLGNVRELHNSLRSMMLGLPSVSITQTASTTKARRDKDRVPSRIKKGLASFEELRSWYVSQVSQTCNGNMTTIARRLDVDRTTVRRWLKRS